MLNFDRSFFFKCSLLALLVAPACADKDGDDEPTDGDSTAAGTSSALGAPCSAVHIATACTPSSWARVTVMLRSR